MSSNIRVAEITMEVITSDVGADPVMVKLDETDVRLSVGDGNIRFHEQDLDEVITVLERLRQLAGERPPRVVTDGAALEATATEEAATLFNQ